MQLPFSIVVEPPSRAELAHLRRFWWVAAIVVGLVLGVCGALALAAPRLWDQPRVLTTLDVRSEPGGAAVVEVDDRRQGYTPAHLILPPGAHHVTLRRPGYGDASYDVTLDARHPASLAATLWLQSPATSELRPPFPGGSIVGADFVRDGRVALTITLGGGRERQIWLVDAQEAYQRPGRSGEVLGLAVSADAARIAYLAPPNGLAVDSTQPPVVWIADAAGDDPRRLDLPPSSDVHLDDLSWAPDGRHLLVVGHVPRSGGGQSSVLLWADASEGAARELARIPSDVVPGSLRWGPDGRQLAFLAQVGQVTSLCLIGLRTDDFHYLADLGHGSAPTFPFAPIAWSADGQRLAYIMFPVVRSASVGWPFAAAPTGRLIVADAGTSLGRTFSPTAMVPLAWEPDGQSDAVVGLTQARRNGPLFLHSRSLSGADRDLVEVAVSPAGRFVARWDAAHARALVAVSDGTTLGTPRWSYWLVRFGEGAS